jgi:FkbM family methyltransferase
MNTNNLPLLVKTRHGLMNIHHPDDLISQQLLRTGEYEWYVVDILDYLLSKFNDGVFLDVGANMASVSLPLAVKYKKYQFHAFEVQPHMVSIINENITSNNITNIQVHPYGLSNVIKTISIRLPDYDTATNIGAFSLNSYVQDQSDIAQGYGQMAEVEVKTLDSLGLKGRIRAIKLDVEGLEQHVLDGAINTIAGNDYPPIVYELWSYNRWWDDNAEKLKTYLIDLGYTLHRHDDACIAIHKSMTRIYEELFS